MHKLSRGYRKCTYVPGMSCSYWHIYCCVFCLIVSEQKKWWWWWWWWFELVVGSFRNFFRNFSNRLQVHHCWKGHAGILYDDDDDYFCLPTSTKPRAWKLSKNNGCDDLFGVHCVEEGDRIPPLQSYGQALKQEICFAGILVVSVVHLLISWTSPVAISFQVPAVLWQRGRCAYLPT